MDLLLRLRVQPRAGKDEFSDAYGDCLKVRITAPPIEGKANTHLIRFLAKHFGVPRHQVTLESGENVRNKRIRIQRPKKFPLPVDPS